MKVFLFYCFLDGNALDMHLFFIPQGKNPYMFPVSA